jgi:hypothetical protein
VALEPFRDDLLRSCRIKPATFIKENDFRGIYEVPLEKIGDDQAIEVFAAAGGVVRSPALSNAPLDLIKMRTQIQLKLQIRDYLQIAV